jgi:hypothetical protein
MWNSNVTAERNVYLASGGITANKELLKKDMYGVRTQWYLQFLIKGDNSYKHGDGAKL